MKTTKSRIDWEQARGRLRASENALNEALTASPMRIEEAYRRRAIRLANKQAISTAVGVPVLIFRLAQERYAIELKDLSEVLPFARCVRVPGTPRRFLGVINRRGEIRAVADLSYLLTGSVSEQNAPGFVLMLRRRGQEIGLKVDSVEDLREIYLGDFAASSQARFVKGIAAGMLELLDLDALLAVIFSGEETVTV